jgi:hypothetical protein
MQAVRTWDHLPKLKLKETARLDLFFWGWTQRKKFDNIGSTYSATAYNDCFIVFRSPYPPPNIFL